MLSSFEKLLEAWVILFITIVKVQVTSCRTFIADNFFTQFLDFSQLQTYHPNGFFRSISTVTPNAPLQPGTKMINELELMKVNATIEVRPA
jgi:hypothetical protein